MVITAAYLGLKPVMESNNMRMLYSLQQNHLVVHHPFVTLYVLLEDDFDSISFTRAFSFSNYAICTSSKRPAKFVLSSAILVNHLRRKISGGRGLLFVVAIWLTLELVKHPGD